VSIPSLDQLPISSFSAEGGPPGLSGRTLQPHLGLQVELDTVPPGLTELTALPAHRLKVHAGPPSRGNCRSHRFVSTHGDVDLFPAGMSDVWHVERAATSVVLTLAPALLERAALDMGLNPARANLEPRHQFRDPQLEHLAWALDAERRAGFPGGPLYTDSLGLAVAARLLGSQPDARQPERGLPARQLRQLTAYIEEHLDRDLTLAQLADVASLSQSHLKTVFRQSTGQPVHAYIMQRRVERARQLLEAGALPRAQVALEAGFTHQSHMARWMRRLLGVTPTAIRHRAGTDLVSPAPAAP
jgi:AraC family transcriptional regulator